jgi:NADH-quinone oxidoreductase subunit N
MPLDRILASLQASLVHDLFRFAPELLLCLGIIVSLLVRLVSRFDRVHLTPFAILVVVAGIPCLFVDNDSGTIFSDLLYLDFFANVLRGLLLVAAALVLILGRTTNLPDRDDSADYSTLILGATLGMLLMISANSLLMAFLALEMTSLPSYVLAGFQKNKPRASEAALKYVVYGAAASGVMLYGISLLAGRSGTLLLPFVGTQSWTVVQTHGIDLPLVLGWLFLFVGFGFKLAAFPFQFWMPDVFDGARAEVAALLAVASKAAAFGLLVRVLFYVVSATLGPQTPETVGVALLIVAMLTATLGNLAALRQSNLKRLLAYSTVAHAGYLLMAAACLNRTGNAALLFYLLGYLPMTIGAFAVVAILHHRTGSDNLDDARGLLKRSPWLAIPLIVFLFSLLGLPPFVGFVGKFQIFHAVYATGGQLGSAWASTVFYFAVGVGVLNSVVSAGYYLNVIKVVAFDEPAVADEKGNAVELGESYSQRALLGILALAVLAGGIAWSPLVNLARFAARNVGL